MTVRRPAAGNDQVAATATASHLPELGCFIAVFADDREGIGWSLEFAVADEQDEVDRELGQDTQAWDFML